MSVNGPKSMWFSDIRISVDALIFLNNPAPPLAGYTCQTKMRHLEMITTNLGFCIRLPRMHNRFTQKTRSIFPLRQYRKAEHCFARLEGIRRGKSCPPRVYFNTETLYFISDIALLSFAEMHDPPFCSMGNSRLFPQVTLRADLSTPVPAMPRRCCRITADSACLLIRRNKGTVCKQERPPQQGPNP